ncbi:MAG: Txe/YoeB family addiction module toxin [Candidatus Enterosoma sp.]|nr:Txe/YoeB family addiction module toxin [Bacilli bacterium]MDD7180767.1 Txe/YoeB family addiction module toxin [Bacilli bacterium]MDY3047050.1 Txe/YoeB family addiction module toxin [Candidatus Enterosoma sp.]
MWTVLFTKNAQKDKPKLKAAGLEKKAKTLLALLSDNPFTIPPSYEKLVGDLNGYYSRRINIQHRLVYRVDSENHIVIVHSMWSHYE